MSRPHASKVKTGIVDLAVSRPVRFLFIGGVNTLIGYGLFAACLAVGLAPTPALAMATVLSILFNFVSTGRVAFDSRDVRRFPVFVFASAALFGVNLLALHALMAAGLSALLAQALLVAPMAAVSYVVQRDIVYRAARTGGMRS